METTNNLRIELAVAAGLTDFSKVKRLIKQIARIEKYDEFYAIECYESGLMAAASVGSVEIVEYLLKFRIEDVEQAAIAAANNGHRDVLKLIMSEKIANEMDPFTKTQLYAMC